jgi:hypothetical protein
VLIEILLPLAVRIPCILKSVSVSLHLIN